VDEKAARTAFETALASHKPGFGTFFLARLLGLEIGYTEDSCIVEFPVRDFLFNPQGSLHGGAIAIALDISMGHLIHHATGGRAGITLEMKVQYLRPATEGRVRCEGRFLRRGRTISQMESRMTGPDGKLLAAATATWQMPRD
jgi:uncharacterized protein (TIGR00369 family)